MNGRYLVVRDGKVVSEASNIITTQGREAILRHLAGEISYWGVSMAFGAGDRAPQLSDKSLEFEFHRSQINFRSADTNTGEVILRADLPSGISGEVHEIGVWSSDADVVSDAPSTIISSFSHIDEDVNGEEDGHWEEFPMSRVGGSSILLNGPSPAVLSLESLRLDIGAYSPTDRMSLAYYATAVNSSSVEVRMYTSETDYFVYSFSPIGLDGDYEVETWDISDFAPVGSPDWSGIYHIEVRATNPVGGGVVLDALRLDNLSDYNDFAFVSRTVLSTPVLTGVSEDTYVEYRFGAF
jgi:hypothetical protein